MEPQNNVNSFTLKYHPKKWEIHSWPCSSVVERAAVWSLRLSNLGSGKCVDGWPFMFQMLAWASICELIWTSLVEDSEIHILGTQCIPFFKNLPNSDRLGFPPNLVRANLLSKGLSRPSLVEIRDLQILVTRCILILKNWWNSDRLGFPPNLVHGNLLPKG